MLGQALSDDEVVGGGNLDVLAVALDEGDGVAVALHYRGVVGEGVAVRLSVGGFQQLYVEGLRCLYEAVLVAGLGALAEVSEGLYHRDDGHHGSGGACRGVAAAYHLHRGEGSHAVVDAHHAVGIVGYQGQTVLHGVETGLTAVGQQIVNLEMVFLAELLPVVLLCHRQHQDDLQGGGVLAEALQGAHEHRSAVHGQKLLRDVAAHAQPFATSHYNDIFSHCLNRIFAQ